MPRTTSFFQGDLGLGALRHLRKDRWQPAPSGSMAWASPGDAAMFISDQRFSLLWVGEDSPRPRES